MAHRAWFCNFEQRIADAQPLSDGQCADRDPTRRDVFPGAPRRDAEFVQRFVVHQQNLARASASPVEAVPEALIFKGGHFLEFAHRLAVRQALK
jgi:hypothetical protein